MKKLSFIVFAFCLIFASCDNDSESTREEDSARLSKMYDEIIDYTKINSLTCSNPEEWGFIQSALGGCTGYILYSKKIDLTILQKKLQKYTKARDAFDKKWGVVYDLCQGGAKTPTGVACVDGKPTLTYSFVLY